MRKQGHRGGDGAEGKEEYGFRQNRKGEKGLGSLFFFFFFLVNLEIFCKEAIFRVLHALGCLQIPIKIHILFS